MKNLLLTTALIAAGSAGAAYAEAHSNASPFMTEAAEGQIQASNFIGMRVYAAEGTDMAEADGAGDNWEDIGEINDVVMSRDGQVEAVLVDIGGFLGLGERQVGVSLDQVKFVSDSSTEDANDFFLVLNADPATLEEAPEFGASDKAAVETDDSMEKATDTASADTGMTGDETMDTAENDVEAAADEAGEELAEAGEATENAVEEAGDDIAQAAENTGEAIEDGAENMAAAADEATDDAQQEMAEAGAEVEQEANEMAAETDAAVDEAQTEMQSEMAEADSAFPGTPVEDTYLTAENLDGARVYDSNDKWVGEISELIVTEDGQITDAIVDVGGFLGIGEKPVALKLTDLQILRQDGGDDVRIFTAMAEEELEAMPEFEKQ